MNDVKTHSLHSLYYKKLTQTIRKPALCRFFCE